MRTIQPNLLTIFFVTLLFGACSTVYNFGENTSIDDNSLLTYRIDYSTSFHVQLQEFSKDQITFQYYFSEPSEGGTISMSGEVVQSSPNLKNYFSPSEWGKKLQLTDQTCVWMARDVFKDMKKGKTVMIDTGDGSEEWSLSGPETWGVSDENGNDVYLPCLVFMDDNPNTHYEIWVLDNEKNPLILKMQLDFDIDLTQVKF